MSVRRTQRADGTHIITKRRTDVPADFFAAEARGLRLLREAGGLRVPDVFEVGEQGIVIEDLGQGTRADDYWQRAARGLATQHAQVSEHFGLDQRGFCGDTPQDNTPDADGWRFFGERRLLPQMRRARDGDRIETADGRAIEQVCQRLPQLIPEMPPVLLHGDLWSGNLHVCADGAPALIDAGAAHYGWAEAELAMMTLFGAPPAAFFAAYAEQAELRDDWRERIPIYNLYHLLNHVNLFGAGYLASLRGALAACAKA
jgi:fructosamine-3-kinase